MTALGATQTAFLSQLLDDELPPPAGWSERMREGLEIYRNNYRTALVAALRETYARTARWVGEAAFAQAAAHHLVLHPPASWTIDRSGQGFDRTLTQLFLADPEVAELAWAEWAMLEAFGARDAQPLTAEGFAVQTATFGEQDWADLRLLFMPGLATRTIAHDLGSIWHQLEEGEADEDFAPQDAPLTAPLSCHVYREGEKPVFITAPAHECATLQAMRDGASFGSICEQLAEELGCEAAVPEAGAMLGRWLHLGLIERIADR